MDDTTHLDFCPELVAMLKSGETRGRSKNFPTLVAVSTVNNLVTLKNLCTSLKPKRTLEVGLAFGGSGLLFTACHRENKVAPAQQHVAIDPFQSCTWDSAGAVVIEKAGLSGFFELMEKPSCLAMPALIEKGVTFDIIYIDGSHIFEDVFVDLYFAIRLLSDGGIVALDDCTDPHVKKVIKFIERNGQVSLEPFDLSPFREDKGLTPRYRVAKLLGKTQMRAFRKIGPNDRPWNSPFTDF
ncbi:class I SAM-dependent methyltransferase [Roseimicrobium sp. ORNL1]|uniref:class I SAM-dependent methyltransferase n=1 Tax=Roseimicrobium sp. ORNL1 TaxID=2711231 RepID=UPI0013E0F1C5|nr:class I SAM-dependent methyltransferase [Roseimicrobium sp. ORNL1]QIF04326.1 class I SAM-dependent methyltransferase [Roseimicrobium sp. ORNL1]